MTHSVTKTFLTTVVGLAWQRGLIRDVNDYARDYMPPNVDLFEAAHNQSIKWADRPEGQPPPACPTRQRHEPGTHYKYNDVRINVLALAALQVWRRPLPDV